MNAIVEFPMLGCLNSVKQIDLDFDSAAATLYWWMRPTGRPCFTSAFLEEVERFEGMLERHQGWISHSGKAHQVRNIVFGSRTPGIFSLGGDMSMFIQAILRRDRALLERYGHLCVENMHRRISAFGCGISTYSLIQGKAFGGGFECALSSDVIVAERSSTFSLPEVLFNMFPGMGAISLLARRIGLSRAEDLVMSGQVFSAKQMKDLGVIDELVEDGLGEDTVRRMIASRAKRHNSYRAVAAAKRQFMPVHLKEMTSIVDIWVDAAMRLETRDLRMMARLVKAQDRMQRTGNEELPVDSLYETLQAANA